MPPADPAARIVFAPHSAIFFEERCDLNSSLAMALRRNGSFEVLSMPHDVHRDESKITVE